MTLEFDYNGAPLIARSGDHYGAITYAIYGFQEVKSWFGKTRKKKLLLFHSRWVGWDTYHVHNMKDFQEYLPRILRMMEDWYEDKQEAGKAIKEGIIINTDKSFLK